MFVCVFSFFSLCVTLGESTSAQASNNCYCRSPLAQFQTRCHVTMMMSPPACSKCGHESAFCQMCGRPLRHNPLNGTAMIICSSVGCTTHVLRFCPYCGKDLAHPSGQECTGGGQRTSPKGKGTDRGILTACAGRWRQPKDANSKGMAKGCKQSGDGKQHSKGKLNFHIDYSMGHVCIRCKRGECELVPCRRCLQPFCVWCIGGEDDMRCVTCIAQDYTQPVRPRLWWDV